MDLFEGRAKVIFAVILVALLSLLRDDVPTGEPDRPVVVGNEKTENPSSAPRPAPTQGPQRPRA
jgi:hypothetical protein